MSAPREQEQTVAVDPELYESGCDESVENYYEAIAEQPGPVDESAASDPWSN